MFLVGQGRKQTSTKTIEQTANSTLRPLLVGRFALANRAKAKARVQQQQTGGRATIMEVIGSGRFRELYAHTCLRLLYPARCNKTLRRRLFGYCAMRSVLLLLSILLRLFLLLHLLFIVVVVFIVRILYLRSFHGHNHPYVRFQFFRCALKRNRRNSPPSAKRGADIKFYLKIERAAIIANKILSDTPVNYE